MENKRFVFGYGSILNPASMAKDVNPKRFVKWVTVKGYERIANVPVDGSLALNIRENPATSVEGIVIEVDDASMESLEKREKGYSAVDITNSCPDISEGTLYAFIAPQESHPDMHIKKEYLEECTNALPESLRKDWIAQTIIENPIG